jgi:D-glucuronyl C5-epimerase C-terminus
MPDYWHPYLEIQHDFQSGKIGRYPVSMDVKADYPGQLNNEAVPIVFLQTVPLILPVTVTLFGLGSHDAFLNTGNKRYQQQMMNVLDWLKNHCVPLGEGIGWPNPEDLPVYGLKSPWFSGLAQTFALSMFVRAHQVNPSGPWSSLAYKTWLGYKVPVQQGGFRRDIDHGVIYEEYPGPELDCVFNGMCFALIGLWEASLSRLVPEAKSDFRNGVTALRSLLPRFTHGQWSLYSLNRCLGKPLLCSPYYQRTNGLLAQIIGQMTGDQEFSVCGERWLRSSCSVLRRLTMSIRVCLDRVLNAPRLLHSDKCIS